MGVPGSGRIPPTVSLQARSVPIQEGQAAADFRDPIDFHIDVTGCVYPIIHNVICKYMYKCKNYIDIHMNTEKIHMFV